MNLTKQIFPRMLISRNLCSLHKVNVDETSSVPPQEPDKLIKTLQLELRSNEPAILKSFCKFAVTTGNHLGLNSKSWSLNKPVHERYTVLKSVHIFKKHRVQYEKRTYFSFVQYNKLTGSTADTLLEYVERNLPEGVALKATKVEVQELPEHLRLENPN